MNDDIGAIANPTTNAIKSNDPQLPRNEIRTITDSDFKNFTYTGISITIPTPLAQVNSDAIFGVNIDGFIPSPRMSANLFRNLFPVQLTYASYTLSGATIKWVRSSLPAQVDYFSHRFISGFVGLGIRVISHTAQPGNFLVTQASGMNRRFYLSTEGYTGLRFNNQSSNPIDYAPNGFVNIDFSLNRNVAILPIRRENTAKVDFAKKLLEVDNLTSGNNDTISNMPLTSQFLEDWLLFAPLGDIPHDTASQITFQFYYDWSHVTFELPMYPIIPIPVEHTLQILLFNNTFNGYTANTIGGYNNWIWWPRDLGQSIAHVMKKSVMTTRVITLDGKSYTHMADTVRKTVEHYYKPTEKPPVNETTT